MEIIYDFTEKDRLVISSFMGDMQTSYKTDDSVSPHTIDITYTADPAKGISKHMTLLGYYLYDAEHELLHMYTPQRMEGHRVAIEECEHLQCRRFIEEKRELPENLRTLSEKERVLLAIKETADVMVEEFRNQSNMHREPDDLSFQDGPAVDLESFTRIMSIPSKYGLTPLKIEEYKMTADKDIKQAFKNLEQRMRDAGAPVQDEDEFMEEQEKQFFMSPEARQEATKAEAKAPSATVVKQPSESASPAEKKQPEPKPAAPVEPVALLPDKEKHGSDSAEKSTKTKKKSKKRQETEESKESFPWLAVAGIVAAAAAVAGLIYVTVGGKSSAPKPQGSPSSPPPPK